jgi:broad specificity phosphatase PhoE
MASLIRPFSDWQAKIRSWDEIERACREQPGGPGVALTLIRHGESTNNAEGLVTGSSDPDLTDRGIAQAEELATLLPDSYDAAFHSGLRRSRRTLEAASRRAAIIASIVDPRVGERSMGELEGAPSRPLPAYDLGDMEWAPPGGEPYISVARRVASFLLDLQFESERAGRKVSVLASTHVGPMRIAYGILRRQADPVEVLTQQFPNAQPVDLEFKVVGWPRFLT